MPTSNRSYARRALAALAAVAVSSLQAADPVITNPLYTSIGVVAGGDVGEGLDLEGDFVYALSIGADIGFEAKIRDATFQGLIDAEIPGATLVAGNRILNWYVVNYGDSANDLALKDATSSIRWSDANNAANPEVILTLENLQVGVQYKFQMMFGEQCCNRGFDVFFDDGLVVKDFNPGVVHGGIANGTQEALITHLYTPRSSTVVLRFDGRGASTDYSDHNAILNAVTVERLGLETDTDNDGMPDAWETFYGLNPNDPSDAALDCNGNGISNLDEFKAGMDPCDTTKPAVLSAVSTATFNTVRLTFSEALDPATATVAANYTITPALAVTAATYANRVVTLTTAAQTPGGTAYTVTVKGVKDLSNFEVPEGSNTATFYSYIATRTGVLKFSFWGGITGTAIQGLLDDPRYPATPDWTGAVFSMNSRDILPTDANENYGATMEGYLTPTESGDYYFFLRSDDASLLEISTDDKEANLWWQAEEQDCCDAFMEPESGDIATTSLPVSLVANRKYFIRVTYKEGGGGDYAQVAWRKVGDTTPAASLQPIPGQYLSAAVDLPVPAEGDFITRTPAPDAVGVSPAVTVTIVHRDGKAAWTADNVSLKLDGVAVPATFTKNANVATITYKPTSLLASKKTYTITLGHPDPAGQPATLEWSFEVSEYKGPIKDLIKGHDGLLMGAAVQTEDRGGHSGQAGDRAVDLGPTQAGQSVWLPDASFLNEAAAGDEMSVAGWQKLHSVRDSAFFWGISPSSSGTQRGWGTHTPWSNNTLYFDTAGCCDATTQRVNAAIDTFPGYTGDVSWWNEWHHFVFQKKGSAKEIWIDGQLFLAGESTNPLPTDFTEAYMGFDPPDNARLQAFIDDMAVFKTALTEVNVGRLFNRTASPKDLPGVIAYWDFNTVIASAPEISDVTLSGGNVTVTWINGGTLQQANAVTGPYADIAGASTGTYTAPATGTQQYFRVRR